MSKEIATSYFVKSKISVHLHIIKLNVHIKLSATKHFSNNE
jgi:hypothetical protein